MHAISIEDTAVTMAHSAQAAYLDIESEDLLAILQM